MTTAVMGTGGIGSVIDRQLALGGEKPCGCPGQAEKVRAAGRQADLNAPAQQLGVRGERYGAFQMGFVEG